ncbi:uncharacterized protein DS421_18g624270 [Arachis hypogaea]|nr:uncharacterized protein DS421_18g624270 [Arachis hypogaea]
MSSIETLAQWVDVTVLGEEPFVDTDFITNFRTHHRLCTSDENEPKYELIAPEMVKKNSRESYQRVQEAKVRSRARVGGARVTGPSLPSPPPPSHNLGTPTRPIVVSSSASSQPSPPPRSSPEAEKKKRKTLESGSSFEGEAKVDAPQFVRKHIYPHTRISMDDASVRNHLTIPAQESIRAAGVCTKFLDIFEKTPLSSLGSTLRVEELEGRLLLYQGQEKALREEVIKLKEEMDGLQERERKLQAQCSMAEGLREKAQESYSSLFEDLVEMRKDLMRAREAYTELEDSIADEVEEAWRIFKEQVGVLAPDLDLSPLDPD